MCWTCFLQYADAPVVNERVQAAYDLMTVRMRPFTDSGLWLPTIPGDPSDSEFLHVIVGDMNVDDCFFDLDSDDDPGRRDRYDAADQWERDIFDALAALTEEERATAVAMEWGYVSRDGELRADLVAGGGKR